MPVAERRNEEASRVVRSLCMFDLFLCLDCTWKEWWTASGFPLSLQIACLSGSEIPHVASHTYPIRGEFFRRMLLVLATFALLVASVFVVSPLAYPAKEDFPSQLLQLGTEQRQDLRKALALEVSKNRYEAAKSRLKALHDQLIQVFDELKQEAVKKESARDDLVHLLAEVNPYKMQAIKASRNHASGSSGLMLNGRSVDPAESKKSSALLHDINHLFHKISFGKQLEMQFSGAKKFDSFKRSKDKGVSGITGFESTSGKNLAKMAEDESRREMEEVIRHDAMNVR
eukprot:755248-Hanusia_phi.AAC.6